MAVAPSTFDPAAITPALVRRLLAEQFPQWADLPITPAEPQGWDNRTFRLGTELSVRLPSAVGYTPQFAKEHRWLPYLAPHLPLPIPEPVARGVPGAGYPWAWSVYRWLDGTPVGSTPSTDLDLAVLARDLATFLTALRRIDATGGPLAGEHSFYRGASLAFYDDETRHTLAAVQDLVDPKPALALWEAALASQWEAAPVWFHGDVAVNNLLVRQGRLAAVIDFGTCGTGDPACDAVIAWTLFHGPSRGVFRAEMGLDPATWQRGGGWALWKALLTLNEHRAARPALAAAAQQVIVAVLADFAVQQ